MTVYTAFQGFGNKLHILRSKIFGDGCIFVSNVEERKLMTNISNLKYSLCDSLMFYSNENLVE